MASKSQGFYTWPRRLPQTELEFEINKRMVNPGNDPSPYLAEASHRVQNRMNRYMLGMTAAVLVLTFINVVVFLVGFFFP